MASNRDFTPGRTSDDEKEVEKKDVSAGAPMTSQLQERKLEDSSHSKEAYKQVAAGLALYNKDINSLDEVEQQSDALSKLGEVIQGELKAEVVELFKQLDPEYSNKQGADKFTLVNTEFQNYCQNVSSEKEQTEATKQIEEFIKQHAGKFTFEVRNIQLKQDPEYQLDSEDPENPSGYWPRCRFQ